jgi:hypothetical protein
MVWVQAERMASEQVPDNEPGPIHWHHAFVEALQLELEDYKNVLEFKAEHHLTTEPLRIDALIIKKPKNAKIGKNFAQIFRTDNICEFKSPGDYLSVKDFYKVMAYANLYAAITPGVSITDITLTFVETKYPRELMKHLQEIRGYTIDTPWPGIHRVTGDFIPIQVLESKGLSESDNRWLKGLNTGLAISNASVILRDSWQNEERRSKTAYLYAVLRANPLVFREVYKMTDSEVTLDDVLVELGLTAKWKEEGREEGREETLQEVLELLKQGYQAEQIAAKLSSKTTDK